MVMKAGPAIPRGPDVSPARAQSRGEEGGQVWGLRPPHPHPAAGAQPEPTHTQRFSFLPQVLSLQDLCYRALVSCTPVHLVDRLPLPVALRGHLKSFSMASGLNARMMHGRSYSLTTCSGCKRTSLRKAKAGRPPQSPPRRRSRNGCRVS